MEKAEKAQADYERQVRKTTSALDALALKEMERNTKLTQQYNAELQEMMKNGASKEELAKKEEEIRVAISSSLRYTLCLYCRGRVRCLSCSR